MMNDTTTGKPSLTTTLVAISALVVFLLTIILVIKSFISGVGTEDLVILFGASSYSALFIGVYYQKKIKLTRESFEISSEDK